MHSIRPKAISWTNMPNNIFISCEPCRLYKEFPSLEEASGAAKEHCESVHKGNMRLCPTLGIRDEGSKSLEYRSWHPDFWEALHPKCVECDELSLMSVSGEHYCKQHNPLKDKP